MYGRKGRLWQDDPEYHLGHQPVSPVPEENGIDRYGQSPIFRIQKKDPGFGADRIDRNADFSRRTGNGRDLGTVNQEVLWYRGFYHRRFSRKPERGNGKGAVVCRTYLHSLFP